MFVALVFASNAPPARIKGHEKKSVIEDKYILFSTEKRQELLQVISGKKHPFPFP